MDLQICKRGMHYKNVGYATTYPEVIRIDLNNQVMYEQRIQKLQKELDIEVTNFENIEVYASNADYQD